MVIVNSCESRAHNPKLTFEQVFFSKINIIVLSYAVEIWRVFWEFKFSDQYSTLVQYYFILDLIITRLIDSNPSDPFPNNIPINSLAPGRCGGNIKCHLQTHVTDYSSWALLVKLLSDECNRISLMVNKYIIQLIACCHQVTIHYLNQC